MSIGLPCYVSATPNGILELLKRYEIETSGKKCVVLGRSNIVGKPMAALMMQKAYPGDATVTVCHSRSKDLIKECQEADIIIAALGQPNFVKAEMVKEGAVVIDVGTTRVPDATKKSGFKLTGDVKFDEVAPKMFLHHSRTGRCWSDDDCIVNEKYTFSWQESHLSMKHSLFLMILLLSLSCTSRSQAKRDSIIDTLSDSLSATDSIIPPIPYGSFS